MKVKHVKTYHQYDYSIRKFGIRKMAEALNMDKAEVSRIVNNKRVVDVDLMNRIDVILGEASN